MFESEHPNSAEIIYLLEFEEGGKLTNSDTYYINIL